MSAFVHRCDWSGQPDIRIACDQSWSTPAWNQPRDLPEGVHLLDDSRFYTFNDEQVTCPGCAASARASSTKLT